MTLEQPGNRRDQHILANKIRSGIKNVFEIIRDASTLDPSKKIEFTIELLPLLDLDHTKNTIDKDEKEHSTIEADEIDKAIHEFMGLIPDEEFTQGRLEQFLNLRKI